MSGSDFNFGWNERENNATPWDGKRGATRTGDSQSVTGSTGPSNDAPGPVSENIGYEKYDGSYSQFFGVCNDDFQVDAFIKCVMLNLNLAREEIRKMVQAPAPQSTGSGSGTTSKPGSTTQTRQRTGLGFLKVEQMTREPKKARIMDYQIPPDPPQGQRKFNDVVLKLYYNGGMILWGLKTTSPHYTVLYELFGSDFEDWKEKEFMLGTEVREFDQRVFAHVEPVSSDGAGKKKK